jgi:hypothetical protein
MSVPDSLKGHPPGPPDDEDEAREADELARRDRLDDYTPATARLQSQERTPMAVTKIDVTLTVEHDDSLMLDAIDDGITALAGTTLVELTDPNDPRKRLSAVLDDVQVVWHDPR